MVKPKQIYRFLTATVLLAMMANVAFPSGLAAAQYICKAEYEEHVEGSGSFGECCTLPDAMETGVCHSSNNSKDESCFPEQICKHVLTTDLSETPVILPVSPHLFTVLDTSGPSLSSPLVNAAVPRSLDKAEPFPQPPLFLLNNVFLN